MLSALGVYSATDSLDERSAAASSGLLMSKAQTRVRHTTGSALVVVLARLTQVTQHVTRHAPRPQLQASIPFPGYIKLETGFRSHIGPVRRVPLLNRALTASGDNQPRPAINASILAVVDQERGRRKGLLIRAG